MNMDTFETVFTLGTGCLGCIVSLTYLTVLLSVATGVVLFMYWLVTGNVPAGIEGLF